MPYEAAPLRLQIATLNKSGASFPAPSPQVQWHRTEPGATPAASNEGAAAPLPPALKHGGTGLCPVRKISFCDLRHRTPVVNALLPADRIEQRIFRLRSQNVMLSTHLAELYEVEPRLLIQAVKRNIERFPADFMFQLTNEELTNLKSQIVISSWGGLRRATPYAFTEQGVAMLSSVLRSPRAVQVNIEIMRTGQSPVPPHRKLMEAPASGAKRRIGFRE